MESYRDWNVVADLYEVASSETKGATGQCKLDANHGKLQAESVKMPRQVRNKYDVLGERKSRRWPREKSRRQVSEEMGKNGQEKHLVEEDRQDRTRGVRGQDERASGQKRKVIWQGVQ